MAIQGRTEWSDFIGEAWSILMYPELLPNLPKAGSFLRQYEGEIRNMHDTVNVLTLNSATGEELTDDTAVFNPEAISTVKQQIIVDRRWAASFEISDASETQSIHTEAQLRDALVKGVAKKIEAYVLSLMVPSAAAPDHDIAPAAASDLAVADLAEMARLFDVQNVPEDNRYLFLSPNYYSDLITKSALQSSDFQPSSPVVTGKLHPQLYGFNVVKDRSLTGDLGYATHTSAISMILQQSLRVKSSDMHAAKYFARVLSADLLGAGKLLDDKRIIKISA